MSGLGEHPKKIWDPLLISATVEASNFKFSTQLGFWTSLPKTTFRTKIGGEAGLGEHPNIWEPLCISATVEASNFKFGIQLGFGTILPKETTFRTKIGGGRAWARGASEKFGTIYFCSR